MPSGTRRSLDLGQALKQREKTKGPLRGPSLALPRRRRRRPGGAMQSGPCGPRQAAFFFDSFAALAAALMFASAISLACLATLLKLS